MNSRMSLNRIGLVVIGLLTVATIAVILLKRRGSTTAPSAPVAIRKTQAPATVFGYEIVGEYPHDTEAYTQGLVYIDGFLYESTGITGRSSLRKVRLETGEIIQQREVNPDDFGEGLTEWRGRLLQLTPRRRGNAPPWHLRKFFEDLKRHFGGNIGVMYDIASFEPQSIFEYPGDGWGLTHDENRLIMSDGSAKLRFLNPETFAELGRLEVFDGREPVAYLNELEFVDGKIYANVQRQDRIAIIEPDSGRVTGWIDLAGLKPDIPQVSSGALHPVLNGIAYDAVGHRLFVTGKLWPKVFQIRLKPQSPGTE
jgi:glutaminyl-peptide cyclotransferase